MHISQAEVESVSLDHLSPASLEEFFAPKQHYKLLALLAKKLGPDAHFIDVGTHLGDSARALSAYGNGVTSFDVEARTDLIDNVHRVISDLWKPGVREFWRDRILSSALIFIDIDPHQGEQELELVRWLQINNYKGLIVLDDIWFFKPMRDNCWHRIESYYKVDATLIGHWSGTGIVSFNEHVSVSQYKDEDTSNWTLVTGYFDLTAKVDANDAIRARPLGHYIDEHGTSVLATDQNLIVFCDYGLEEKIWSLRPRWLHTKTRVVPMSFEEFSTTRYLEKIIENRGGTGACGRDPRNTASYYLFCMARYGMLQRAIENNPFRSTHFAWINICIERMGFNNLIHLPGALAANRDEFSTCWIDYVSKETTEDLASYFGPNGCRECRAACTMCSGFFTGRADYMNEVCGLLIREFERCVQLGYGHADEQLFPIVYYKNPNLFRWYIGDYAEMITNYEHVRERPERPLRNLIRNSHAAGDTETCERACALLTVSLDFGICSLGSSDLDLFDSIRRPFLEHGVPSLLEYESAAEATLRKDGRREALTRFIPFAKSSRDLLGAKNRQLDWASPNSWNPLNVSVCVSSNGARCAVIRTVNYTQKNWEIKTIDGAEKLRSRNYVLILDQNWRVTESIEIRDASGILKNDDGVRSHGFEDCRLHEHGGVFYASASVRGLSKDLEYQCAAYGSQEMATLTFTPDWQICDVDVVRDYERALLQKNWMPISGRPGEFLYLPDPTIAIRRASGKTEEFARNEPSVSLSDARGGSQLIPYRGGWLCVVHEVADDASRKRFYFHRIVRLDASFRVLRVSDLFFFERADGVEFCSGLARDGDRFVASFGMNDGTASYFSFFETRAIDELLFDDKPFSDVILPLPFLPQNAEATAYVCTQPAEGIAQLSVLKRLGCLPHHRVLEIGCGALVAGYPIVQYLESENYRGIDPNGWLASRSLDVDEVCAEFASKKAMLYGTENFRTPIKDQFDFIISHSILSHASNDQLTEFLIAIRDQLTDDGVCAASIRLAEGNEFGSPGSVIHGSHFQQWVYPGVSWFRTEDVITRAKTVGLRAHVDPELTRLITSEGNPKAVHDWIVFRKTKTLFVTAFFRLNDRPVDEGAQFAYFRRLAESGIPIVLFLDERLAWPERHDGDYGKNVAVIHTNLERLLSVVTPRGEYTLPDRGTSGKDTEQFLLLQNAKLQLLDEAALQFDATHYAWIDFAIMKISARHAEFAERLQRLSDNPRPGNSTPGCWEMDAGAKEHSVCWRFCGGLIVIASENVAYLASKNRRLLARSNVLTWEVNNWAKLEHDGVDFGWYRADHDDSILGEK